MMVQGIQCWDAAGNLTLDANDRITKILATFDAQAAHSTTLDLPMGNTPFAIFVPVFPWPAQGGKTSVITVSGSTFSWTASTGPGTIICGCF